MNASRFAVGLVGVALAGLWYFAGGAQPLPVSRAAETPRVTKPLSHENLTVYFVYGTDSVPDAKVMTLNEALERELAIVHETSDVNTLAVENKSPDYELFIQSGDIVKGGKQDRMAATDMLLPPKSGVVPLPAHCVEQGRWTGRGAEDSKKFASSLKCAVGNEMKIANFNGQQSAVWQNVSMNQTKLNDNLKTTVNAAASPTSFQLTLEAPALQAKVTEYEASLKAAGTDRDDIIGVVFVVNGKVTGAEVYGSNALFRKAWPKLLNSAAVEAVAERTDKPTAEPPSAREIEYFLARAAEPEPTANNETIAARNDVRRLRDYYGIRGQAVGANEDVGMDANLEVAMPDNDRVQRAVTELRSASTRNRSGAGRAPAGEAFRGVQTGNFQSWTIGNWVDMPVQQPGTAQPNRDANTANDNIGQPNTPETAVLGGTQLGTMTNPPRLNGQQAAPFAGFYGNPYHQTMQQPAAPPLPDGNRLNSNRNENRSTLMVESRDPARQNAVIHRSYLKK